MSEIAEDLRGEYEAAQCRFKDGVRTGEIRTMQLIERISRAEGRVAKLEALAPRWREEGLYGTHWETCWQEHRLCALDRIARMQAENAELREEVGELEAAKQKAAQEWLHLDAANRVLIEENKRLTDELETANANHRKMAAEMAALGEENKRLRECADAMAKALDNGSDDSEDSLHQQYWRAFPREEYKP